MNKGSSRILHNSVYNVAGWLLPVIVNFLTVPYVVRMLGDDSYGILMLFAAVIGYFSIIDINLTAGSMKYVSEYYAKGDYKSLNEVLTLSLLGYAIIGLVGAVFLYASVHWFLMDLLKVPEDLRNVAQTVFQLASIGFALGLVQKYLSSIPQSVHRFDTSAKIEAGFGVALMLLTVLLLYMGFGLLGIVILRVVILFLNLITIYFVVKKLIPFARFNSGISRDTVRKIFAFSGYSFLSKIASTVTSNSDRLVIGSMISSAAVTIYSVPFLLVSRLMSVTHRLSMVLFPVASEMDSLGKREELQKIYIRMNRYIFFLNISIITVLCLFARQILQVWMGNDFAEQSYVILILISLSCFFDTLTQLPSLVNDGFNFPRVTGFFGLTRAIVGVIALITGAFYFGLIGVAAGYFITSLVMGNIFLFYVHKKTIKISFFTVIKEAYLNSFLFILIIVSGILAARSIWMASTASYLTEAASVIILFAFFAYRYVLDENLKSKIFGYFR